VQLADAHRRREIYVTTHRADQLDSVLSDATYRVRPTRSITARHLSVTPPIRVVASIWSGVDGPGAASAPSRRPSVRGRPSKIAPGGIFSTRKIVGATSMFPEGSSETPPDRKLGPVAMSVQRTS
jgi:hypothetical protein